MDIELEFPFLSVDDGYATAEVFGDDDDVAHLRPYSLEPGVVFNCATVFVRTARVEDEERLEVLEEFPVRLRTTDGADERARVTITLPGY